MTIQFPSDIQEYVRATVANGVYANEQELVINAVQVLRELKARHEQLRRDVQLAIDQCDRGEAVELDVESIKSEGRRLLAAQRDGQSA